MKRQYRYVVYYVRDYRGGHTEMLSQQVSKATYYKEKKTGNYRETHQHGGTFIIHELKPLQHG